MINAVITDKNNGSKELIQSYLKDIEGIGEVFCYDDLNSIDCNLKNIDIIIFDTNSNTSLENLVIANEYKKKYKNLSFIAMSYEISSELVSRTLRQNIDDFLIKPVIPNVLCASVKKILDKRINKPQKKAKTLCFYSNKGGCGRTSTAVNTAYEIASQTNEKVCLLDLSFNFGDVATYLDVKPRFSISSVVKNLENSDSELAYTLCEKYKDTNLYVMSFIDDTGLNTKCNNPDVITKLINSLKNLFDYIVIDTQSTLDETSASIFFNSDLIFLIATLNMISIRSCQKCVELLNNMEISNTRIKLILNRYIENSEIKPDDIKNILSADIFHKIPNNYLTLIDAINIGQTVGEVNPHSNIAKAYHNLACDIINIDYTSLENSKSYNHGIYNLLRRMGD